MKPKLTLTFDNGPTPGITERVLASLADAGLQATFFLVGTQLEQPGARALAHQARVAGHRLGNHTYSHGEPLGLQLTPGAARDEILRMHDLMAEFGQEDILFRPNGRGRIGSHILSGEAVDVLEALRATVVLWSSVPRDRAVVVDSPRLWVEDAKRAVLGSDWTLMALHDRPSGFPDPGPIAFLSEFLGWAKEAAEIVQDFPVSLTPMIGGVRQPGLAELITGRRAAHPMPG